MAVTKYSYTKKVNVAKLQREISLDTIIVVGVANISRRNDDVDIYMKKALTIAQTTALTNLVTAHDPTPIGTPTLLMDDDGATMVHPKMAATGRHYQLHGMTFTTATEGSFKQLDENHNNLNYGTMEFRDNDRAVISGIENMHKVCCTVVDWEPPFDYEIMGGMFHQRAMPSGELILNVTALPDIPAANGGNIRFVVSSDLRFIGPDTGLHVLGHTTSELTHDPVLHTNKLRMTLHHGSGVQHDMYMAFEIFVG